MQPAHWYAALAAFGGAVAALVAYHLLAVRPAISKLNRLTGAHDSILAGGAGGAAGRLGELEAEQVARRTALEELGRRIGELEAASTTDLSCMGFVRYGAFEDTGSDLSYALALLDRKGDGVVLTSLYSRTDTRTYGKAVERFKPAANASEEELQAIEIARLQAKNG